MTFLLWLLLAVLVVWGIAGPYLGYAAGLAGTEEPPEAREALRRVVTPRLGRKLPQRNWLPTLDEPWLWPTPTQETRTEGPPRMVWVVPIPEQPREILPLEFTDGDGTSDDPAVLTDERLPDTPVVESLRDLFRSFAGDPILGGAA